MNPHPYCRHFEGEHCHCDRELERTSRLPNGARRQPAQTAGRGGDQEQGREA